MTVALILGYIAQKIKLSPLVGYLIAGILVSPHSPGFVADMSISQQCAEIGIVLLMFGVGMHFKLKDLIAVKNIAVAGALAQIATSTIISAILVKFLGWSWTSGIILGIAETMTKAYVSSQFPDAVVYAILIIMLLVKPSGLLGKKQVVKV